MIVLGLLATVLSGFIGSTVQATVLLYTEQPMNASVQGVPYSFGRGVHSIPVAFNITKPEQQERIIVTADSLTYEIPLTILGKRNYMNYLWLLTIPVAILLSFLVFRRIRAGSS